MSVILFALCFFCFHAELVVRWVERYMQRIPRLRSFADNQFSQAVFQIVLDRALQRACPELDVISLRCDIAFGLFVDDQLVSDALDALVQTFQLYVNNAGQRFFIQLVKGNDLVQTVYELRRKRLVECLGYDAA